jgi:hypothetical protein
MNNWRWDNTYVSPRNWDEIIDEDDADQNWAEPGSTSSARSHPVDGDDNDYGESEEHMHEGENRTRTRNGIQDVKGQVKATEDGQKNQKGRRNVNIKGKDIVKQY